ncbi:MAG TPA: hypothetical protein VNV43_13945 [Candidatus Acidoferrales bacterium]|nr:hypothetical protein [Candidatus Acidoferrales bacterium]
MPSLHSVSQVSSLRRIDRRDQSAVEFSAGGSKFNPALVAEGFARAATIHERSITNSKDEPGCFGAADY